MGQPNDDADRQRSDKLWADVRELAARIEDHKKQVKETAEMGRALERDVDQLNIDMKAPHREIMQAHHEGVKELFGFYRQYRREMAAIEREHEPWLYYGKRVVICGAFVVVLVLAWLAYRHFR